MRRMLFWALGVLAFAALSSTVQAQYYNYPQYPYGYGAMPAYRVMPVQYPGGYYGYGQGMVPAYRPAPPMYYSQPMVVPGSTTYVAAPTQPVVRNEPVVTMPEGATSAPLARPLPSTSSATVAVPATSDRLPTYYVSGGATGDCGSACGPECSPAPHCAPAPAYRAHGCCADGKQAAFEWDRDAEPRCHVMAGGGAMYIRPYYANNTAFSTTNLLTLPDGLRSEPTEFGGHWETAPYGWFAVTGKHGLGVRGRAWSLDQTQTAATSNNSPLTVVGIGGLGVASPTLGTLVAPLLGLDLPDQLSVTNSLRMRVVDLEAIWQKNDGPWSFLIAGGARWADLQQLRVGSITNLSGSGANASSQHDFQALGGTFALESSFALHKHFGFYVNGRGSLLYGDHNLNQTSQVNNLFISGGQNSRLIERDWLPVLELEAGVQIWVPLGECSSFVLRGGITAQTWIDAGSSVSRSGNLDLIGGIVQAGFAW